MTRKEAIEVLIKHAVLDVAGTGCGIRPPIKEEDRYKVKTAIVKLWPLLGHCWCLGNNEWLNYGLPLDPSPRRKE